ncbi:hypothetical protein R1flu_018545 [Riccia fluitans]|uniref:Uncharacterized protein n=1 Tax=Riccia fluitans TaxID=41844 RepID=A0ABD1ZG51_9MARC
MDNPIDASILKILFSHRAGRLAGLVRMSETKFGRQFNEESAGRDIKRLLNPTDPCGTKNPIMRTQYIEEILQWNRAYPEGKINFQSQAPMENCTELQALKSLICCSFESTFLHQNHCLGIPQTPELSLLTSVFSYGKNFPIYTS